MGIIKLIPREDDMIELLRVRIDAWYKLLNHQLTAAQTELDGYKVFVTELLASKQEEMARLRALLGTEGWSCTCHPGITNVNALHDELDKAERVLYERED